MLSVEFAPRHINALELRAILLSILWILRSPANLGKRSILVSDSQVCIAVLTKGRSAARTLAASMKKVTAAILAGSLSVYLVHVESSRNPADAPSRYGHDAKA